MKLHIYIALAAMGIATYSCSSSKNNNEPDIPELPKGVEVTISTTQIETKAAVLEFGSSSKMNVFAKTYQQISAPNIVDGVIATYDGAKWTMEPKVYINDNQKNAFIWAVAPYDASYTNAQKIPVDLAKQVDLMYSGSYQPASLTSPNVKITMKHALSLLSFNITPVNYSGQGNLTSLEINGDIIYSKGTMDANSGKISLDDKGAVKNTFNKNILNNGCTTDIPGLWVLPFNTKTGEVLLTATIDGKTHQIPLPEAEVKTGWQYIFRLALTDSGLEFDPSKTETISLNVTTDNPQEFFGYGKITLIASGDAVNTPNMKGSTVFGTVSSPLKSASYSGSNLIDGLKSGDKVVIESWNSDGFTIDALSNIQTIDISQYE